MQRIIGSQTHSKTHDMQRDYYLNQKKAFEINPRHPLIKELLRRVEDNPDDSVAKVKTSPWISFKILTFCHIWTLLTIDFQIFKTKIEKTFVTWLINQIYYFSYLISSLNQSNLICFDWVRLDYLKKFTHTTGQMNL